LRSTGRFTAADQARLLDAAWAKMTAPARETVLATLAVIRR